MPGFNTNPSAPNCMKRSREMILEALEERIVLDGAVDQQSSDYHQTDSVQVCDEASEQIDGGGASAAEDYLDGNWHWVNGSWFSYYNGYYLFYTDELHFFAQNSIDHTWIWFDALNDNRWEPYCAWGYDPATLMWYYNDSNGSYYYDASQQWHYHDHVSRVWWDFNQYTGAWELDARSQYAYSQTTQYWSNGDTDLHCSLTYYGATVLDWWIFNDGSDGKWSGGALNVVLVDYTDFFECVEQYTKTDVIVIEYDLGNTGLDTVVDGLGILSDYYNVQISNLAVMSHGNSTGMYFGEWISTSNYATFYNEFAELNRYMMDNGQIMLYHCQVGAAATMLSNIAAWTGTDVFANRGDQWYHWYWYTTPYQESESIWNHNYDRTHLGEYVFEYKSDKYATYNMLFNFA